ncbi:MAG TPA: hypothetical protein VI750_08970 [Pyrinomonadaceae bacterium]|nr:hypothetical protein [Pyrinomonadaceae bacterium]
MLQGLHTSPLRERLLRGLALFFLLFTFANVSFPPPCSEINEGLSATQQLSIQGTSADVADYSEAVSTNSFPSDQSPEKGCCDEDCCFACAHVLSAIAVTEVAVFDMKSLFLMTSDRFMPEPPLRSTYHPPRFA